MRTITFASALLLLLAGCPNDNATPDVTVDRAVGDRAASDRPAPDQRPGEATPPKPDRAVDKTIVDKGPPPKPLDLLFVVDNSLTISAQQTSLVAAFPALLDALKVGGRLPDLRIGVVSTDLGAGKYTPPSCEVAGGDGGKLQSKAQTAGCSVPTDPWISYVDGVLNVPGIGLPEDRLKNAFGCIAPLGTGGCGFEQPLAAAKRALDPAIAPPVNAGFLRSAAPLGIIIVTNEDDCSATAGGDLFDPAATQLGTLSSFRCTQWGIVCDQALTSPGVKTNCHSGDYAFKPIYLEASTAFTQFFKGLKPTGKLLLAAIAGPVEPFDVDQPSPGVANYDLKASCQGAAGSAVPAVRVKAVTDGLGALGLFNQGVSTMGTSVTVNACSTDFSPALRLIGQKLAQIWP